MAGLNPLGGFFSTPGLGDQGHNIPILGPLFMDNPAEQAKLDAMRQMADALEAYRPQAYDARMRAMRQSMGAFQPANQMLQQMYGTKVPINTASPFPGGTPPLPQGADAGGKKGESSVWGDALGLVSMTNPDFAPWINWGSELLGG